VQHTPHWWVKIGDFGISKRIATSSTVLHTRVGTGLYLAPEVFHYVPVADDESEEYTNAVDIWSLACVIFEMLAIRPPFVRWPRELVAFCNGGEFPETPLRARNISDIGIKFVKTILVPIPTERPSAEFIMDYNWFQTELPSTPTNSTSPQSGAETTKHEDIVTIVPSGPSTNARVRPRQLSMIQSAKLSNACSKCNRKLGKQCYNCGVCHEGHFNLCIECVRNGEHCDEESHWLVRRDQNVGDESGIGIDTKTLKSGWALFPIPDRNPLEVPTLPYDWATTYRQQFPRNKRIKGVVYDYCFECHHTFSIDDPPKRHIWEDHDARRVPGEAIYLSNPGQTTQAWYSIPSPEEQSVHEQKLVMMEAEMKAIYTQKVSEKEQNLKKSEEELYDRHRELKDELEQKRVELTELKTRLETAPPVNAKKERRNVFTWR
jgi:serine/threonine protein kinase